MHYTMHATSRSPRFSGAKYMYMCVCHCVCNIGNFTPDTVSSPPFACSPAAYCSGIRMEARLSQYCESLETFCGWPAWCAPKSQRPVETRGREGRGCRKTTREESHYKCRATYLLNGDEILPPIRPTPRYSYVLRPFSAIVG